MTDDDQIRYARQIALPQLGAEGQARLAHGSALIIGLGGLGATAALYLGNAGVGHLVINDYDRVDASNLPRQILFTPADVDQYKTHAAAEKLRAYNPELRVSVLNRRLAEDELAEAVSACDRGAGLHGQFHHPARNQPRLRGCGQAAGDGRCDPLRGPGGRIPPRTGRQSLLPVPVLGRRREPG